ncbi:MAG: hypothetical protein PWQ48_354 [Thermotogaceae bacterium]|nr:hypothetical protein [Thermotogaceae bacterium]
MTKKIFLLIVFLLISIGYLYSNALFDIRTFEYIEYKVNYENQIFYYRISLIKKGSEYEVTTSTRFSIPGGTEELTLDDIAGSTYASYILYFFNPAYEEFLNLVNLQNPETLEMYGIVVKYEGTEKVGKYQGEKFTLIINDEPQITWIISKNLKMLLKVELPQGDVSMELVDFKKGK